LEGEVDETLRVRETGEDEGCSQSVELDQISVVEPDPGFIPSEADVNTLPDYNTSTTPTYGAWEREKALQATYSDTKLLQDAYTRPDSPAATSTGKREAPFDPRYVTNDHLHDRSFAEPIPPVAPLQYTPYRKPQPLSPGRYLPYQPRNLEQEDVEYRPYRKNFW
jgi:hypothetical protein